MPESAPLEHGRARLVEAGSGPAYDSLAAYPYLSGPRRWSAVSWCYLEGATYYTTVSTLTVSEEPGGVTAVRLVSVQGGLEVSSIVRVAPDPTGLGCATWEQDSAAYGKFRGHLTGIDDAVIRTGTAIDRDRTITEIYRRLAPGVFSIHGQFRDRDRIYSRWKSEVTAEDR